MSVDKSAYFAICTEHNQGLFVFADGSTSVHFSDAVVGHRVLREALDERKIDESEFRALAEQLGHWQESEGATRLIIIVVPESAEADSDQFPFGKLTMN